MSVIICLSAVVLYTRTVFYICDQILCVSISVSFLFFYIYKNSLTDLRVRSCQTVPGLILHDICLLTLIRNTYYKNILTLCRR